MMKLFVIRLGLRIKNLCLWLMVIVHMEERIYADAKTVLLSVWIRYG